MIGFVFWQFETMSHINSRNPNTNHNQFKLHKNGKPWYIFVLVPLGYIPFMYVIYMRTSPFRGDLNPCHTSQIPCHTSQNCHGGTLTCHPQAHVRFSPLAYRSSIHMKCTRMSLFRSHLSPCHTSQIPCHTSQTCPYGNVKNELPTYNSVSTWALTYVLYVVCRWEWAYFEAIWTHVTHHENHVTHHKIDHVTHHKHKIFAIW